MLKSAAEILTLAVSGLSTIKTSPLIKLLFICSANNDDELKIVSVKIKTAVKNFFTLKTPFKQFKNWFMIIQLKFF